MFTHNQHRVQFRTSRMPLQCGFALLVPLILFLCLLHQVGAREVQSAARDDLHLQVSAGYQSTYRENYWEPVTVSITNDGANFKGKLTVQAFAGALRTRFVGSSSPWNFEQVVSVAGKAQQQVTVYAPFSIGNFTPIGFIATLLDEQGKVVTTQATGLEYTIRPGDLFIGVLAGNGTNFAALNIITLPHQADSLTLSTLDAKTFPDNSAILKNFDILLLDNFPTNTLSRDQLTTLQTWVEQGGILIEIGGADGQRTLGPLPATLLPVKISGTQTLPAGTTLLPADSAIVASSTAITKETSTLSTSIRVSTATDQTANTFQESKELLSAGPLPLIVQAQQGEGAIYYVGFDMASQQLSNWAGIQALWTTLLLKALGDGALAGTTTSVTYPNDPGQLLTQGGIVRMLVPGQLLQPGLILLLLLVYVLMLGPIRVLIVRGLKQPKQWAWHLALITILLFSSLSFGIAAYQRHALQIDNTVSLIRLTEGSSAAHILTYHGLLSPDEGTMKLALPAKSTVLPLSSPQQTKSPLPGPTSDPQARVDVGVNATALTLPMNKRWSYQPLLSERDTRLGGALTSALTLHKNRLSGTITNTLATALSDTYILLPNYFIQIGHIGAGETKKIDEPIHTAPLQGGKLLADALAREGELPAPYFPYGHSTQTNTDFEQHMALLSALSGAGMSIIPCSGACVQNTIVTRNTITLASAPLDDNKVNTSYDPLLLSGAAATFIGWADQPLDGTDTMTINGSHPEGRHENFIQMALPLSGENLEDAPAGFFMGDAVDLQNSEAQFLLPGIYSLSSASMLFEFTMPAMGQAQNEHAGISIPVQWQQISGHMMSDSSIQVNLYNWRKNSWDNVSEQHGLVPLIHPDEHIGTHRQIFLEITNPINMPGPLIFGKPSLTSLK